MLSGESHSMPYETTGHQFSSFFTDIDENIFYVETQDSTSRLYKYGGVPGGDDFLVYEAPQYYVISKDFKILANGDIYFFMMGNDINGTIIKIMKLTKKPNNTWTAQKIIDSTSINIQFFDISPDGKQVFVGNESTIYKVINGKAIPKFQASDVCLPSIYAPEACAESKKIKRVNYREVFAQAIPYDGFSPLKFNQFLFYKKQKLHIGTLPLQSGQYLSMRVGYISPFSNNGEYQIYSLNYTTTPSYKGYIAIDNSIVTAIENSSFEVYQDPGIDRLAQGDPRWGSLDLGNGYNNEKLSLYGCTVTSATMVINYYLPKIFVQKLPNELNDYLKTYPSAFNERNQLVSWDKVSEASESFGGPRLKIQTYTCDTSANRKRLYEKLSTGAPQIVHVKYEKPSKEIGNHYMVAIRGGLYRDEQNNLQETIEVIDPARANRTNIAFYGLDKKNEFAAVKIIEAIDPLVKSKISENYGKFTVMSTVNTKITITDQNNLVSSFNYSTGEIIQNIPESSAFTDFVGDSDENSSVSDDVWANIEIITSDTQKFKVELLAIQDGDVELTLTKTNSNYSPESTVKTFVMKKDEVKTYEVQYTNTPNEPLVITEVGASNKAPVANFTATPSSDDSTLISFDGSTSTDEDGQITEYLWDFGDGETGVGQKIDHQYKEAGTKKIVLKIKDNSGAESLKEMDLIVNENDQAFIRGDLTRNGRVNFWDSVWLILKVIRFAKISCDDAADINDDGTIDFNDLLQLGEYLIFRSDRFSPKAPFPAEGMDETADELTCKG